jgi:hypothetical protein
MLMSRRSWVVGACFVESDGLSVYAAVVYFRRSDDLCRTFRTRSQHIDNQCNSQGQSINISDIVCIPFEIVCIVKCLEFLLVCRVLDGYNDGEEFAQFALS